MRLFGVPNGAVDGGDRSAWLTGPFDLSWVTSMVIPAGVAAAPWAGYVLPEGLPYAPALGVRGAPAMPGAARVAAIGRKLAAPAGVTHRAPVLSDAPVLGWF